MEALNIFSLNIVYMYQIIILMHCTTWHCYKSLEKPKSKDGRSWERGNGKNILCEQNNPSSQ